MPTPLYVIKALAEVNASGLCENMLDRDSVEMLVTDQRAAEWLNKASDIQYTNALVDMAAAESDDWMPDPRTAAMEADDQGYDPLHYDQSDFSDDPDDFEFGW